MFSWLGEQETDPHKPYEEKKHISIGLLACSVTRTPVEPKCLAITRNAFKLLSTVGTDRSTLLSQTRVPVCIHIYVCRVETRASLVLPHILATGRWTSRHAKASQ